MSDTSLADPVIDWGQIGRLALTATLAGVGIPAAFSFGLLGWVRAGERRTQARPVYALAYGLLTLTAGAVCAGALYLAIATVVGR